MKYFILSAISLCLISCSSNEQSKLIETYVCTIDGVLNDFKFKEIELKENTPITVVDSMVFYVYKKMPLKYSILGDSFNVTLLNDKKVQFDFIFKKSLIDELLINRNSLKKLQYHIINNADSMTNVLMKGMREKYNPYIDYKGYISKFNEKKKSASKDLADVEIEIAGLETAKKYSLLPSETILLRSFDCKYSIFNPVLRIKQTLTQRFYFVKELTKVIGSTDIK